MIYLFLGEQPEAKDPKINEIKSKILTSPDAAQFDYELLHAPKLDPDTLKKSLMALPAVSSARVVVVRQVQNFTERHQKIILDFAENDNKKIALILDADTTELPQAFLKKISAKAKVFSSPAVKKKNVFDITNAIGAKNPAEALKVLSDLIEEGNHPLQIMGGLVWYWGKSKEKLSKERFQKGLRVLQQADYDIKRSRLEPQYALEVSVLKLISLTAS